MESLVGTLVTVIQLALSGFVAWGGWLVLRDWVSGTRTQAPAPDFERVASLVLLALLCTTLAAAV